MRLADRARQALHQLRASREDLEAHDESRDVERHGACPITAVVPRHRARVTGVLQSVTFRPASDKPVLVARLYDGTGAIDLVWLGRRRIPGIRPGAHLVAEGTVTAGRSRPTVYNPSYQLLGTGR